MQSEWSVNFVGVTDRYDDTHGYSYTEGWRSFCNDEDIGVEDFLIFEILNTSTIWVHIYPRDDSVTFGRPSGPLIAAQQNCQRSTFQRSSATLQGRSD